MKFSILMPTWNRPQFLPRAVAAVMRQTWPDWELHIAAAGSSLDCELPRDPRIKISRREPDEHCLNRLMKEATGDVFCVAADDDELIGDALEVIARHMDYPGTNWVYGLIRLMSSGNPVLGRWGSYAELLEGDFIPFPASFWRREVAIEFDEAIGPAADYDYWLRLWKVTEPVFIPRVLSNYGVHAGQESVLRTEEVAASARRAQAKALQTYAN